MKSKFDYSGSSFDSFLEEEGIREEVEAAAMKRVIAWQIQQAMQAQSKSKLALAREMHTSRTQVSRLLDPTNTAISLDILARAARVLGKTVTIHFINKNLSKNKNLPRVAKAPAPAHSSDLSHR